MTDQAKPIRPPISRVLGLKQLLAKQYKFIDTPPDVEASFGRLVPNFTCIIWGKSGNGKSNCTMQLTRALMPHGKVLYMSLEEGHEATIQATVLRTLDTEAHMGKIEFADHTMTFDQLMRKLKKKKSPQFIVIDSLQYWGISYQQYQELKEAFPRKAFIFISHSQGRDPLGSVAKAVRYDVGIKVHVEGFVAFIVSRYGSERPYIINEQRARLFWGAKYNKVVKGLPAGKPKKTNKKKHEQEQTDDS